MCLGLLLLRHLLRRHRRLLSLWLRLTLDSGVRSWAGGLGSIRTGSCRRLTCIRLSVSRNLWGVGVGICKWLRWLGRSWLGLGSSSSLVGAVRSLRVGSGRRREIVSWLIPAIRLRSALGRVVLGCIAESTILSGLLTIAGSRIVYCAKCVD